MGRKLSFSVTLLLLTSVIAQAATVPLGTFSDGAGGWMGDHYGSQVAFMPDYDGDGVYDIAISAPMNDSGGEDAGAVFIHLGPITASDDIGADAADIVLTGPPMSNFGSSLAAGDFNGDGLTDLLVGAPGLGGQRGAALMFHGGNTSDRSAPEANATFPGFWTGQRYGESVACICDLNGDEYDDFAIGAGNGNRVYVYEGTWFLETPKVHIPELEQDLPNPVDFTSGVNSTGNTFGLGNTTDGWDWAPYIYGGSVPDVHFAPLVNQGGTNTYLGVVMGNETDGGGMGNVPPTSGGYGIDFEITEEVISALHAGADLHLSFRWTTRDAPTSGFGLVESIGEVYWVKARFWNSSSNATYLGWDWDNDSNPGDDESTGATTDSTDEIVYIDWGGFTSNVETYTSGEDFVVDDLIDGAHTYYFDAGGKLAEWSTLGQNLEVRIDDVDLRVEFPYIVALYGPSSDAGFGRAMSSAGDVNLDGYDDLLVGAPGTSKAHIYFGGPDFAQDFQTYYTWALPESQHSNDTTLEPNVNDLWGDDGSGTSNYYTVQMAETMLIDTWYFLDEVEGDIIWAYLYMEYKSWAYNGNNWVRWAKEGGEYQQTDVQPVNTNWNEVDNFNDVDGPYPFHDHGLMTTAELEDMDLEFTNNAGGGGSRNVYIDFMWIYVGTQRASNVTIAGEEGGKFGASVAALGSIDGDPYGDVVIGDPAIGAGAGGVYVFNGGRHFEGDLTYEDASATFMGSSANDRLGSTVAGAGTFSLDKYPDIAMGAPGRGNGTVYIVRGGPSVQGGDIGDAAHYAFEADMEGSSLGASIVTVGDINGKHADELLVGAPLHSYADMDPEGRAYILYNTDEDVLSEPLIVDFYPDTDPTIDEGKSVDMGVVIRAPEELKVSILWYLDGELTSSGRPDFTYEADHCSAGTHDVLVKVSDGFRSAEHGWTVTVMDVNGPPVVEFHPAGDPTIDEGTTMRFWVVAKDPDLDPLTYIWVLDGAPLDEDGPSILLEFDFDMAGSHNLTVHVSDGEFWASNEWDITVMDINRPPVIDSASPGPMPVMEQGTRVDFSVSAHDPDGDDLFLIWYIDGEAVAFDTFVIPVEAGAEEMGPKEVLVRVSDGDLSTVHIWEVEVVDGNLPPVLDWSKPESPVLVDEGGSQMFWVSAHDPDGDNLTVTWLLDGTAVGSDTSYELKPRQGTGREHNLTAVVSDGLLDITVDWQVLVNRRPVIDNMVPETGAVVPPGQVVTTTVTFHDPDGDDLTVIWLVDDEVVRSEEHAGGAAGSSTLQFSFAASLGVDSFIKVMVQDDRLSASENWRFSASETANRAPNAVITYSPEKPKKGKEVSFDGISSSDPDGDLLTYTWTFSDGTTATGRNVTRELDERGALEVTLTVDDTAGNSDTTSELIVIGGYKRQEAVESPWGPLAFLLLLIVLIVLLVHQAKKRGWLAAARPRAGGKARDEEEGEEDEGERRGRVVEDDEAELEDEDEDDLEGEHEEERMEEEEGPGEERDSIEDGDFEEIPVEDDELDK